MRLALIFNKTRADTTGIYFERACRALNLDYGHWWLRDADQIPTGYDLYLRVDHGDDYERRLPDALHPTAFYAIDSHVPHSWRKIQRVASRYDIVFCAQHDAARRLRCAQWLPLACDLQVHGPVEGQVVWDVAFVGTDGGVPRKFYLQALRERYPQSFIGTAEHTQLGSIYSRARIGFNYSIANDVNMRMFEVMAAGALLMTNALSGEALARLGFEDRRHLVLYQTPDDVLPLIDYYLAHPQERQAIATTGASLVRGRHTYAHRLKQLLGCVSQRYAVPTGAFTREPVPCSSS